MSALLEGYLVGLALIILIGPVLFVLLHTTLSRGRACGLAVATGIMISDLLAVALCFWGGSALTLSGDTQGPLAWGGGALTLGLGLRYLIAPPLMIIETPPVSARGLLASFSAGFMVNFINPFVFLVWIGIISVVKLRYQALFDQTLFLSAAIAGIYTLDLSKVYLAHHLKPLLKPSVLRQILRGAGGLLILFSLRLFYTGYYS